MTAPMSSAKARKVDREKDFSRLQGRGSMARTKEERGEGQEGKSAGEGGETGK